MHGHLGQFGPHQQVAEHDLLLALELPPADNGPQPGIQLGEVEGLDEVVVGTKVEAGHFIVERIAGSDNKHASRRTRCLEGAQQVEAGAIGQGQVE